MLRCIGFLKTKKLFLLLVNFSSNIGLCKIAKLDHGKDSFVYFINLNSFYYTIHKDIVFIKLVYEDTISYLFPHFDKGLSSITI
jgi:hypothetical protein